MRSREGIATAVATTYEQSAERETRSGKRNGKRPSPEQKVQSTRRSVSTAGARLRRKRAVCCSRACKLLCTSVVA